MANTTTPTVPIDLLGAVNELLAAIGQSAVVSLQDADLSAKAADALEMLNREAVIVQQSGWNYNTEQCYAIDPDPNDGSIYLPDNCLSARVTGASLDKYLGVRGKRLYDLKNSTFNIGTTVWMRLVVALEFGDIPAPIRWYIVAKAGRRYAANKVPAAATARFTEKVEMDAMLAAQDYDETEAFTDMPTVSPHMQKMRRR